MKKFTLQLQDATRGETFIEVSSFIGSDESGSFSLWAGHQRFMTELVFGLARFKISDGTWRYLALPGALLYFCDNTLALATRRYFCSDSYEEISTVLSEKLQSEEENLRIVKKSFRQMEDAMLKCLYEINQRPRFR